MDRFVVVPAVTVSDCLFHGVWSFCVNVRIPLRLFSLVSPSAWRLSIVTDGRASSDWSLGPMLVCVCLGDVCVVIGLSLMFLVFFCLCVDKKSWSYLFYHNKYSLDIDYYMRVRCIQVARKFWSMGRSVNLERGEEGRY